MSGKFEIDFATLIQIGTSLVLAGGAYAATTARIDAMEKTIAGLERQLERERDERLASDRNEVADRALWFARVMRRRRDGEVSASGADHQ